MRYCILVVAMVLLGCSSISSDAKQQEDNVSRTWYQPHALARWQWQLKNSVNTTYDVDVYDIDLFDVTRSEIALLHERGKKVICYFSAGSYENWREDAAEFSNALLGKTLDGWPDEKWLDISNVSLKPIIQARLDLAKSKGCDAVEPDNVDGYSNDTGFALTAQQQIEYNLFLANEAHERGLGVGLKNDLAQVLTLQPFFDFAVNEQCYEFDECQLLTPFIQSNKAVFHAEYAQKYVTNNLNEKNKLCEMSKTAHFSTLILPLELDDSFRISCE